jgi:hypothetical protein
MRYWVISTSSSSSMTTRSRKLFGVYPLRTTLTDALITPGVRSGFPEVDVSSAASIFVSLGGFVCLHPRL